MKNILSKIQRQTRIRKKAGNVSERPRLSVFRSNKYIYAQIIDKKGDTILGVTEKQLDLKEKSTPTEKAKKLGAEIAKKALSKKISEVAFDKGRFSYHGRIKAVAEGAREGGLKF